jgi:hypothetical protein
VHTRAHTNTHTYIHTHAHTLCRIHQLAVVKLRQGREPDWLQLAQTASLGMGPEYKDVATVYSEFVAAWSGGEHGEILAELESYERTLSVKRKLAAADLRQLAKIRFHEAPRWVPAMLKTLLNAPGTMVENGFATVFSASDYNGLSTNGRFRKAATDACEHIRKAHSFINAYGTVQHGVKVKLLSELEVRMVMFVHQKKTETRARSNVRTILQQFYDDLSARCKVPAWTALTDMTDDAPKPKAKAALREVRLSGEISTTVLADAGIYEGVKIVNKADKSHAWMVQNMSDSEVVIEREGEQKSMAFAEALTHWEPHKEVQVEVGSALNTQTITRREDDKSIQIR